MDEHRIKIHNFSNGMTLVSEEMKDVSSASFVFLLPGGCSRDPEGRCGTATVLDELVFRGAGSMDNRQLNERLDGLGLQRQSGAANLYSCFSGALIADNLDEILEIYSDIIMNPTLSADQFEPCRGLALQSLDSLEDDPRQKISLLVKEKFLPYPYGRPSPGRREELQQLSIDEVKSYWSGNFTPRGSILAVAGKVDFEVVKERVEKLFSSWKGEELVELPKGQCNSQYYHQQNEGAQVHIGVMYPSVNAGHENYYKALTAVNILSGGMGSRLFTEVREKRGLCYAVGAIHNITGKYGAVQCYAGSSPDRAQETLDVMINELVRLADGITEDELGRAKVGLRASLIMQGESTAARAIGCASDYYHLGRVRSLEEIEEKVISVTVDDVLGHVSEYRAGNFTIATIGPRELKVRK